MILLHSSFKFKFLKDFISIRSKDSVTVAVDAIINYRIQHPIWSITKVSNAEHSTRLLSMTTLRNILGTRTLSQVLIKVVAVNYQVLF